MPAPDKLIIDTPEQIDLEYPLASAGSRFLALAIDTSLQLLLFVALLMVLMAARLMSGAGFAGWAPWVQAAVVLGSFLLVYGYFTAFEALWSGQTPGKRAIGLRVITVSGRPITAIDAILRNLLRIVDSIPGIYAVGLVSVFLTTRNQRLGDLVAGTVVVHERAVQRGAGPAVEIRAAPRGAGRLDAREVEAMEAFLRRRGELPDAMRERTARQLAGHVRERLQIPVEHQPADEVLLEELIAEYRRTGRAR